MTGPLCYEEARRFQFFGVTEGGPNGLAIIAQALASGVDVAPVVMPCTGARFTKDSLKCLQGKIGRIYIDNDAPGREAAEIWAAQLTDAGIYVDGFRFDGLKRNDGEAVEDINDLCRIDVEYDERYGGILRVFDGFRHGRYDAWINQE